MGRRMRRVSSFPLSPFHRPLRTSGVIDSRKRSVTTGYQSVAGLQGLGSLSNDDVNVNETRASRFLVHFSAVTARLRRENTLFHVLWRM